MNRLEWNALSPDEFQQILQIGKRSQQHVRAELGQFAPTSLAKDVDRLAEIRSGPKLSDAEIGRRS